LKISTKGRYGLRALIDIAKNEGNEPVSITSIASRQGISERYLEQLMGKLKRAGILNSIRGASGGYILAKDSREISVGDILRALEGSLKPVDCLELNDGHICEIADSCASKYVWNEISESINRTVDGIKLDRLVEEETESS